MNPVFNAAAEAVELGWLMGGLTVAFLVFFIAWALWAWAPGNRDLMDRAARMPLDEE